MSKSNHDRQMEIVGTAIPIGAGAGVALGLVLMQIGDNPGLFALGIAIGVVLGTTVGLLVARRQK